MTEQYRFFSSGSTMLDLVLGGGWAMQHVFNIVGDKSTGKTLLAIEGMANFKRVFKKGRMRYAEAEAAFDPKFAQLMGFPPDVEQPDKLLDTVEAFDDDLRKFIVKCNSDDAPGLYILDSLDALSDEAEIEKAAANAKARDKGTEVTGSFGAAKAKKMSELFRRQTRDVKNSNVALGIISQIRDRIGVTFGEHYGRSGGHALDFYASQVLWLAETNKIKSTAADERPLGVDIHAKCKKLKVGMPFRECDFPIIFQYGVDDEMSMLEWLKGTSKYDKETAKKVKHDLAVARKDQDYFTIKEMHEDLKQDAVREWAAIEEKYRPKIQKYRPDPTPEEIIAEAKVVATQVTEMLASREAPKK